MFFTPHCLSVIVASIISQNFRHILLSVYPPLLLNCMVLWCHFYKVRFLLCRPVPSARFSYVGGIFKTRVAVYIGWFENSSSGKVQLFWPNRTFMPIIKGIASQFFFFFLIKHQVCDYSANHLLIARLTELRK